MDKSTETREPEARQHNRQQHRKLPTVRNHLNTQHVPHPMRQHRDTNRNLYDARGLKFMGSERCKAMQLHISSHSCAHLEPVYVLPAAAFSRLRGGERRFSSKPFTTKGHKGMLLRSVQNMRAENLEKSFLMRRVAESIPRL